METSWGKSIFHDWPVQKGIFSPISVKMPSSATFNPSFRTTCCQLQWLSPAFVYTKRSNPRWEQVFHLTVRAALMCWHGSSLFLSIHPPNSCFFLSLSSCITPSPHRFYLSLLHFSCLSLVLIDLFEVQMYTGQWNILVLFSLLFLFFSLLL